MTEETKKRLTSKVVWASVIAQVLVIVVLINPGMGNTLQIILTALLEIATAFGVLNNPTSVDRF